MGRRAESEGGAKQGTDHREAPRGGHNHDRFPHEERPAWPGARPTQARPAPMATSGASGPTTTPRAQSGQGGQGDAGQVPPPSRRDSAGLKSIRGRMPRLVTGQITDGQGHPAGRTATTSNGIGHHVGSP